MDTACGTAYVDTDEERRATNTSDKELSVAHSQGTPEEAPHAITTMVNYIGVTVTLNRREERTLSAFHAALAKIFGRQPQDA